MRRSKGKSLSITNSSEIFTITNMTGHVPPPIYHFTSFLYNNKMKGREYSHSALFILFTTVKFLVPERLICRKENNIRLPILTAIFLSGHQYWHPICFPVTNIDIHFLFQSPVLTAIFFSGHLVLTAIFFAGHQYWQGGFCQQF